MTGHARRTVRIDNRNTNVYTDIPACARPRGPGRGQTATCRITQANRLLELATPLARTVCWLKPWTPWSKSKRRRLLPERDRACGRCAYRSVHAGRPAGQPAPRTLGRIGRRVWHGHVTAARFDAANGGFRALSPAHRTLAGFLRGRQDSFAFNDSDGFRHRGTRLRRLPARTRCAGPRPGNGAWPIAPRIRRRSLTTQYQETDFASVERLLAEEDCSHWFEHADGDDAALGSHVLIIADHNGAFAEDPQGSVRLHRADVTEPDDTVQAWPRPVRGWQAQRLAWSSWDYRGVGARPVTAETRRGDMADAPDLARCGLRRPVRLRG